MPKHKQTENFTDREFVIVGGGPAGLTAAYELTRLAIKPTVFEKRDRVGGIARTENYKGYYFDMGGHRFFTKSKEVNAFWQEIMGDEFLRRPRLSRIFYNNKFFYYPLKPLNALLGLGPIEGVLIILSYFRWQLFPYKVEETFEQWVTNRFGKRLFETFFKSYTEKVWGIPCSELKAEWAAQRIKDLSLKTAVINMLFKPSNTIKTLIEEFDYPRRGPGMMWEAVTGRVEERGGTVHMQSEAKTIHRQGNRITGVTATTSDGKTQHVTGTDFISSMPVTHLITRLDPPPPPEVLDAASNLKYRDFLTVCLIVNQASLFPDNWIYIHEPRVKVGRIQNFKNWSPDMVPDQSKSSLGLEYFCNEGDELWTMADADLIELGKREMAQIGLAQYEDIEDGAVFRVEKSYPVYDSDYRTYLTILQEYLATLENFQTIGRNGLHRYNNQDHTMLTAIYAVRNMLYNENTNLWLINAEEEYHEEIQLDDDEGVEVVEDPAGMLNTTLAQVFLKLDPVSFGTSLGVVGAILLFIATLIPALNNDPAGLFEFISLLSQYFPGYGLTIGGSFLGLLYGFLSSFILGWVYAFLRNTCLLLYVVFIQQQAERSVLRRLDDFII